MDWRRDLWINARRSGVKGLIYAWFLCPGFKQAMLYRWSHRLQQSGRLGRILGVFVWRWGVASSGCYISPMARIGHTLYLPHPVGIVIGEGTWIGNEAVIYQHVTFGVNKPEDETYPVIGDRVMIYSGAKIVGSVKIGDDAIIGANSVVTRDVPAGCVAAGVPARILREGLPQRISPQPPARKA